MLCEKNAGAGNAGFRGRYNSAMPTIFTEDGFRFFFYSNEGSPREPVHVHVEKDGFEAKFWLNPDVALAYNDGYDARSLRRVAAMVAASRERIERAWNEFFG
ncbi:MAG: DUF4160 domain-containing protein [Acidobacteriota bacterium]